MAAKRGDKCLTDWWEQKAIVNGIYDSKTLVRWVLDHCADLDEPMGNTPPTYGYIYRTKGRVSFKEPLFYCRNPNISFMVPK